MVNPQSFRKKIQKILSQDYSIKFLGDDFDKIVLHINDNLEIRILEWIDKIKCQEISHIKTKSSKKYKEYKISELLVFRFAFNLSATKYRILLVKVKNLFYIEFHLGEHNYYDKIRDKLGLRNR